jgi:hypothetical protein
LFDESRSMQDLAYSSPSKIYPPPPPVLRIASKHAGLRDYECAQCETGLRFQSLAGKILMSKDLGPRVRSSPDPAESFGCTMISGFWRWRKVTCHRQPVENSLARLATWYDCSRRIENGGRPVCPRISSPHFHRPRISTCHIQPVQICAAGSAGQLRLALLMRRRWPWRARNLSAVFSPGGSRN